MEVVVAPAANTYAVLAFFKCVYTRVAIAEERADPVAYRVLTAGWLKYLTCAGVRAHDQAVVVEREDQVGMIVHERRIAAQA